MDEPDSTRREGRPALTADRASIPFDERPGRLIITEVSPSVNDGAYPTKRVLNDIVDIAAIIVCDSHMELGARVVLTSPDGQQPVSYTHLTLPTKA